ncbi:MAG: response regulator transcription factor [Bacteroidetes bacterium]|nr:response regulator transcription factor [Bacteroidota bacterium]
MKIIILEDEKLSADRLNMLLKETDPHIRVVATLENVAQSIDHFCRSGMRADLLLANVHLAGASPFELFKKLNITIPVIFIAPDDRFAFDAFQFLCIDYLLTPVTPESLTKALEKFRLIRSSPGASLPGRPIFKSRFLGRIGQRSFFIHTTDIAMITASNRIVHLVGMDRTKYLVDHTLDELEQELEPSAFFRINRSAIIHARAIEQVKPFINHRLRLTLKCPLQTEEVIVSRDRVHDFKKWADF